MKKTVLAVCGFVFLNLLISCMEEHPVVKDVLAAGEVHYNFETGEKLGEKSFTYDNQGNLIHDYYEDFISDLADKEIKYEYDADGHLLKKMSRYPNISEKYYTNIFTYENGLKKSESSLYDGKALGYRTLYFYSGNLADSAQLYYYSTLEEGYKYMSTTVFENDDLGRIVKATAKKGNGTTVYRYEGNMLIETCGLVPSDIEYCIKNEYNDLGKLVRIFSNSPWRNELQEELFYVGNVLNEKKVYTYPAYEPGNTIDITLIKYNY